MKSCLEAIWLNQWRAQAMMVKAKLNDWTIGLKDEQRVVEGLTPWQSWARTRTWAANDRQPGHECECIFKLRINCVELFQRKRCSGIAQVLNSP